VADTNIKHPCNHLPYLTKLQKVYCTLYARKLRCALI